MNIQPIKIYKNLEINNIKIRKNFYKKKGGIYCLVNLLNGNIYIGSSINIGQRIKNYLNKSYLNLKANKNMPICKAL
jgi:excinuclease UvrABC nuclease subunit